MDRVNQKGLRIWIIVLIGFSVWSSSCAREGRLWRKSKALTAASVPVKKPMGHGGRSMLNSATFNVLDYGAKGDGHADDTKVILYIIKYTQFPSFNLLHHFIGQIKCAFFKQNYEKCLVLLNVYLKPKGPLVILMVHLNMQY